MAKLVVPASTAPELVPLDEDDDEDVLDDEEVLEDEEELLVVPEEDEDEVDVPELLVPDAVFTEPASPPDVPVWDTIQSETH